MRHPPLTQGTGPHSLLPGVHGSPVTAQTPRVPSQLLFGQSSSVTQVQKPAVVPSPPTHSRAGSTEPEQFITVYRIVESS